MVLGPLGGRGVADDVAAADWARDANEPFGTEPPFVLAVADWIRAAAAFDIVFLGMIYVLLQLFNVSPLGQEQLNKVIGDNWGHDDY